MNLDWLAGFFDGEGSIGVHPRTYSVTVSIGNTDESSIRLIYSLFPTGKLSVRKRSEKWKTYYEIVWSTKNAIPILEAIKDKTHVKRTRVELALKLISMIGNRGDNEIIDHAERIRIASEISALNGRGNNNFSENRERHLERTVFAKLGVSRSELLKAVENLASKEGS